MTRRGALLPLAASLLLLAGACTGSSPSSQAGPSTAPSTARAGASAVEVLGPVEGGTGPQTAAFEDLAALGYTESEYFYGGTASSYVVAGDQGADGVWNAGEGDSAEFRSRMIVRRPQDSARFSGTVVVEWLNVTIGWDTDPSWRYSAAEITREGHAWVGVSAQKTGVTDLKNSDPQRYGSLVHPGDAYSFDIFTQAARSLVERSGPSPLGGLEPETLMAMGQSQSASYLISYVNGVHPLVDLFDGFLVHSPLGIVGGLTPTRPVRGAGSPKRIRTDLDAPTLVFVTETDLTVLGYAGARQPDSDTVRTWEVAGAAHADAWLLSEFGGGGAAIASQCPSRMNEGPHHQTLRAALHHLVAWVTTGERPPVGPRIQLTAPTGDSPRTSIERDEHGNAVGGIRTPFVDVPVSTLSGEPAPGNAALLCSYVGSTTPFDPATLTRLYPNHESYVEAYIGSTEAAVDAGFILQPEADAMVAAAQQSPIGTGS